MAYMASATHTVEQNAYTTGWAPTSGREAAERRPLDWPEAGPEAGPEAARLPGRRCAASVKQARRAPGYIRQWAIPV